MSANSAICIFQCSTKLIQAQIAITGYTNGVRIEFPIVVVDNPARPTRAGSRKLMNPTLPPITVMTAIGSATCNAFQAMCNGNNIGTVTITELDSDGKNAQAVRQITLQNAKVIGWRVQGDRDGAVCAWTMTFTQLQQTRTAVNQAEQPQGKVATKIKKNAQATK